MPLNAMDAVKPDYCLPADEIASLLSELVAGHAGRALPRSKRPIKRDCVATMQPLDRNIEPQGIPCPECGGFLVELGNGETRQFRCHVGHTFSLQSLSEGHADALERALWVALRKLKEQRVLQQNLAQQQKDPRIRKRFDEAAIAASYDIQKLNDIISRL